MTVHKIKPDKLNIYSLIHSFSSSSVTGLWGGSGDCLGDIVNKSKTKYCMSVEIISSIQECSERVKTFMEKCCDELDCACTEWYYNILFICCLIKLHK